MPRKRQIGRATALLFFVLGMLHAGPAQAQDASWHAPADTVRRHAVQVWAGHSPGSVRLFGKIEDARLTTAGVRYVRLLARSGAVALDYTADVLPLVTMTYAPVIGAPEAARRRGTHTLRGLGLTPAGLRLRGRAGRRWQPYVEGGAGVVRFTGPLPDRRGERFNFTLRVGVGVRVQAGAGTAVTLGYRFHHLSNGFRGAINPGFDSNLFHLGLTVAWF